MERDLQLQNRTEGLKHLVDLSILEVWWQIRDLDDMTRSLGRLLIVELFLVLLDLDNLVLDHLLGPGECELCFFEV